MNKEEFKADHFDSIEELLETIKEWLELDELYGTLYDDFNRYFDTGAMQEMYFYIKELQQENKQLKEELSDWEIIFDAFSQRPYAHRYLEEKRKDNPNLLAPDSEEIYKDYYELKEKCEYLKNSKENKNKWFQLIADIGYDYDGCNTIESLKGLIDELVQYALNGRDNDDFDTLMFEGE